MRLLVCICCLLLNILPAAEVGELHIRSVVPMTESQMLTLRSIADQHPEARALVRSIEAEAALLLDAQPRPVQEIHYEGLVNTNPRRIETVVHLQDMDISALLMRHWQASGSEPTAAALRRFIHAWASTYQPTGNDVNENKLVPLFVAYLALRINFTPTQRELVDAWIEDLAHYHLDALQHSDRFNNRYTKHLRLLTLFGLIMERPEWLALTRDGIRRFVTESLEADGSSYDFKQRDTLTYHCSSLKPPIELAMLLGEPDLYTWEGPQGGSLQKSVAFVVPYATGAKIHEEWVDSKSDLDQQRADAGLEAYRPGRLFEPRSALGLMIYASFFEPALLSLALALNDNPAERYPQWRLLVQDAIARDEGL
jgi:hypothetical protein